MSSKYWFVCGLLWIECQIGVLYSLAWVLTRNLWNTVLSLFGNANNLWLRNIDYYITYLVNNKASSHLFDSILPNYDLIWSSQSLSDMSAISTLPWGRTHASFLVRVQPNLIFFLYPIFHWHANTVCALWSYTVSFCGISLFRYSTKVEIFVISTSNQRAIC